MLHLIEIVKDTIYEIDKLFYYIRELIRKLEFFLTSYLDNFAKNNNRER